MENKSDRHQLSARTRKLRKQNPGTASISLRRQKDEIVEAWEIWVRQEIKSARNQETLIVRDSLEQWLDELIETLDPLNYGHAIDQGNRLAQEAGLHRAVTPGYSLPEMLKEYSLLRKSIFMMLEEDTHLDLSEREVIDEALDTALSLAANEFSNYQQSQLRIALSEAEKSNRDLERFAAIAAHDLKSPLATVSSYLDILKEDLKNAEKSESLMLVDVALANSRRMLILVDRLLEYSRIRGRKPEFEMVNLTDVANVAIENLKVNIEEKNAKVGHENLPTVRGDTALLIQLFQNLIANGIKFNLSEKPQVLISCERHENHARLDFKDNGIGFDPSLKWAIFEPYKRLTGQEFQGAGLGLATVQRVAELLQAEISVESQPGQGSTFSIEFKL